MTFTLMKLSDNDELSQCTKVLLHARDEQDVSVEVHHKRISAPSGNLSILSGTTDVGHLRPLTAAPVLTEIMTSPDHWIEVCGQRWVLTPVMRRQLKDYVDSL